MLRKIIVGSGALMLLAGLLFGREAVSYVKTSAGWMHQTVKDSVPIEFELERARKMIRDLDPEIRKNMTLIAREEVAVERLAGSIQQNESQLAQAKADIQKLNEDLRSGDEYFVYAKRTYSAKQVRDDLENRFQRFKSKEDAVSHLRKVLEARQSALQAAHEKLEAMMASKSQLEVDVEQLEARMKMVQVAQTRSNFNFDDSHLARTKTLLGDIQARIDVAARLANADEHYHEEIPVRAVEASAEDISKEITRYFESHSDDENFVNLR
jgi:chromosome segregation ATPase